MNEAEVLYFHVKLQDAARKRGANSEYHGNVFVFVWAYIMKFICFENNSLAAKSQKKLNLPKRYWQNYSLFVDVTITFLTQQIYILEPSNLGVLKIQNKTYYTYLQNKRMRRCGVAPPPIIFERLKLPQQIIYRRKENLSESPNHQKYWENILVSRFYEQFSRNRRNLGHFRKFEKISDS